MKTNTFVKLLATAVLTLIIQPSFSAGFHYQLDLTAKLINNPQGELTALQMSWIYDKELSAILMDGEDLSEAKRETTLKERTPDILSGLTDVKYFTTLLLDNNALEFAEAQNSKLSLNKESRLQMNLTLPLKKSQTLKGHKLDIILSDDSAVGLATFIDTGHMLIGEQFKSICKEPTLIQKKLAEVDGHAQITETMTINCQYESVQHSTGFDNAR